MSKQAVERFKDWRWRLDNLYYITDKEGRRVQFKLNWAQERLFKEMHYMNVVLKARQLGFTTFIQLFMLDACIFNKNMRAGTIAHTLDDAQTIFRDKVRFPYDNLPEGLKRAVPSIKESASELMLGNNSSIRVGTSLRSGTLQYLHISEYGKLCAKFPDKAREVRTGALNTVQAGQVVFIESTADGQEGHFFDICEETQAAQRRGDSLSDLDFKFHFFPWWENPDYELDPQGVVIEEDFRKYFETLALSGVRLSLRKQAWYVKKAATQLSEMKREYPSTAQEAFEASVEGAYYGQWMAQAELAGRVGNFPAQPGIPVDASWDIGIGDYTSIWFHQTIGEQMRLVGFYQNSGEGLEHYLNEKLKLSAAHGWGLGQDYWPHDGTVREWGSGKSRQESYRERTGRLPSIVPRMEIDDGIQAVRRLLPSCVFDEAGCSEGIRALKAYRKEWDEQRGVWKDRPRHDSASHAADAFRCMASRYRFSAAPPEKPAPQTEVIYTAGPDGRVASNMSIFQAIEAKRRRKEREAAGY